MTKDKADLGFSLIRLLFLFLIGALFYGTAYFYMRNNSPLLDEMVAVICLNISFFLIFLITITNKRKQGIIFGGSTYAKYFCVFLICFLVVMLMLFVPEKYVPKIIIPMILTASFDASMAMGTGVYFICFYGFCSELSAKSLICIILLTVLFTFLLGYLKENSYKNKLWVSLIITFSSFVINLVFSYTESLTVERNDIIIYGIVSALSGIFTFLLYNIICKFFMNERQLSYETIIDVNYPIIMDIKRLSILEYNHAVKVANLAGECATLIGADRMLAMAGGLYYHAASIAPELDDERFLKKLTNRCFPPEVIKLISEKALPGKMPSSKESAIVQMADSLITKFEAILSKANDNTWNTQMVVYQTLNEFSQKGFYDNCNLSMNEFLRIRDHLAATKYIK